MQIFRYRQSYGQISQRNLLAMLETTLIRHKTKHSRLYGQECQAQADLQPVIDTERPHF